MTEVINMIYSPEFIYGVLMLCSAWVLVVAYCYWLSGGFK